MKSLPGFFYFRWKIQREDFCIREAAVIFKVPGRVDLGVLADLVEHVCKGPIVPDVVVLIHLAGEDELINALNGVPFANALIRYAGRLPFLALSLDLDTLRLRKSFSTGFEVRNHEVQCVAAFEISAGWLEAGVRLIFDPEAVIITAPSGYVFQKPSGARSSYFIRADLGLASSPAVFFVALAVYARSFHLRGGKPLGLRVLFVDTMGVANVAFALRELLSSAGVVPLPQIESFHSYDGLQSSINPLPSTSLCLISASTSMKLHREWVASKHLAPSDVITLITFADAPDSEFALAAFPADKRPVEILASAAYDIRVSGEYFLPAVEPLRKVLLTRPHHSTPKYTDVFRALYGTGAFDLFRANFGSDERRGLYVDGEKLLASETFRSWFDKQTPQWLKVGVQHVVFQDDDSSRILAQHVAYMLVALGGATPTIFCAKDVPSQEIDPERPLIAVAAIVGRGSALLGLSRDLRNKHRGPRLYIIGMQVAESPKAVDTFDKNLKYSATRALIDVKRISECLSVSVLAQSFEAEKSIYLSRSDIALPEVLRRRLDFLRKGAAPRNSSALLASGANLDQPLVLNEDFAFWDKGYRPGAHHAEVVGTIASILQNARSSNDIDIAHRLRSPTLMHVALDPENFSRFNEGVIHASFLRASLASELDYRGDLASSKYMRIFLERMATRLGRSQQAEMEFILALATGKLRLSGDDFFAVRDAFRSAINSRRSNLADAIKYFLQVGEFSAPEKRREAF